MSATDIRARRGYTVIEVMMAMAVLGVGVSGIIAMQKVTAAGNQHAKDLALANQLARTWIERLRTDAVTWNHPSAIPFDAADDLNETRWLKMVNVTNGWFRPSDQGAAGAPTFDALGGDVHDDDPSFATSGVFCTNIRLRWLYGPALGRPPFLIRAEVRVFWQRPGGGGLAEGNSLCDPEVTDWNAISTATARYHFVYATSGIWQNMAVQR